MKQHILRDTASAAMRRVPASFWTGRFLLTIAVASLATATLLFFFGPAIGQGPNGVPDEIRDVSGVSFADAPAPRDLL